MWRKIFPIKIRGENFPQIWGKKNISIVHTFECGSEVSTFFDRENHLEVSSLIFVIVLAEKAGVTPSVFVSPFAENFPHEF